MMNSVLKMSKEQIQEAIQILNPCMNDYIYVYNLIEDYYVISEHATERFLLPSDKFYNAAVAHETFVYPDDMPALKVELQQIKEGKKHFHNMKYRWLDKNLNPVWINCRGTVLFNDNKEAYYLVGCINEIGVAPEADNVSGLLGVSALNEYIREECKKTDTHGFIMRLGIDHFSAINTNYGMGYGDFILRQTTECIKKCLDDNQKLFRVVADEFIIADFSQNGVEKAVGIYLKCKRVINDFIEYNKYKIIFTLSAGIIDTKDIRDEDDSYIKLSEFALKKAKDNGRNNYYLFRQEDFKDYVRKRNISRAIHNSVNNNFEGFDVYYQPLVDTKTYRLTGAEALMRFSMPKEDGSGMEYISPVEFIPILEETGLIIPAGRWILDQSVKQCSLWRKEVKNFRININVSYIQVMKSDVLTDIMSIIEKYKVEPSSVGIELTESGFLDSNAHFKQLWSELKNNGVVVILDDFGTGYSNLHCLGDLKPNYIKIDRSFTLRALDNQYDYELMTYIIDMAHSLGLKLCIEGVETSQDLKKLKRLGPDYIQGYLFGKPYPSDEFAKKFLDNID